jgi:NAD(P)-dependent dehydrogenase (short-subunit alcohol dehydrogenase family)
LEFTRQYLERVFQVFAASRNAAKSKELGQLRAQHGDHLAIHQVDVGDEDSRRQLYRALSSATEKLDLLINCAGIISGNEQVCHPLGQLQQEELCKTFLVNSVGPLMMTEQFLPLLKNGAQSIVVNIASDNGSISRRKSGGKYGYCASKAALNMMTKILSLDLRPYEIIVVSLHPGWVKTTMTRNENAPLEPSESIGGMIQVIESLEMKDSGRFLDWQGNELPW